MNRQDRKEKAEILKDHCDKLASLIKVVAPQEWTPNGELPNLSDDQIKALFDPPKDKKAAPAPPSKNPNSKPAAQSEEERVMIGCSREIDVQQARELLVANKSVESAIDAYWEGKSKKQLE